MTMCHGMRQDGVAVRKLYGIQEYSVEVSAVVSGFVTCIIYIYQISLSWLCSLTLVSIENNAKVSLGV